ncbi:MAG: nucleotidyltransferase domain-containing protein, partial [Deltaproteobacteria bacterium]|nr:nucleotidyltransferase domain-containing protein [Deltaproteobacteria bacterium]
LIGSLVWGRFGERSDADVVVRGLAPSAHGATWAALEARVGVAVDLLRFEDLPDDFGSRVLEQGVEIHVA